MLLLARRLIPILMVTIQCAVFLPSCGGGPAQFAPFTTPASLEITTTSLPGGTLWQAYSAQLTASGGTTPYTWSIASGQLPAGLSLNAATGAITGTPTQEGSVSFTVRVTDSTSPTAETATASLTCSIQPGTLTVTTTSLPNGTVGKAYSAQLAVSGGTTSYTWSITSGQLPAGLSLSATTGAITGTPTQAETSSFAVEVEDASNPVQTATADLSMTVSASSSSNCATGQSCGAKAPFCTSYTPPSTSGATAISSLPYKITSAGNYYLTGNLSVPSGEPAGISIQASNVDINLNGYTLTYGAGGSSATNAVGQYGIISCDTGNLGAENLNSVYGTNGYCSNSDMHNITIENGTITQSPQASGYDNYSACPGASVGGNYSPNPCAPGGNNEDTYYATFSHNVMLYGGYGNTVQHVTFNFQNVSSDGIVDIGGSASGHETFQCNTFNNNVVHIDNRSQLEGFSIWSAQSSGSGDVVQYNTIVGGPQGGILDETAGATVQYNDISIGAAADPSLYSNGFAIYGGTGATSTSRYNYVHNYWGRGVADGPTNWTETGDYITTTDRAMSYEYNTSSGSHPGCVQDGTMGMVLRSGGTTENISGVFSSVNAGACPTVNNGMEIGGAFGISLYQWNGGDSSSNSTYQGHALAGFAGGSGSFGWEATGLGIITGEGTPPFGNFTSTNDTFVGDSSVIYMDWGGLPSGRVTLISPTLTKGSNPVNFNTFRFQNAPPSQGGGNVCSGCFHIRDATFENGAAATDADMEGPISTGATAEYWIDWTYTLTVTSGGNPLSGASVTIKDALGDTTFTGTTNANGQIVAVLTQFRMYSNSTAMLQEDHTPDAVTVSNAGCTTLNYNVTMTGTTSDSRTLTCP